MYLLICAVNSYLYDISMECKVYMNSSLPPYQNIMQSSHYENMPMQYTTIFHGGKNHNFQVKHCDIFLIFA